MGEGVDDADETAADEDEDPEELENALIIITKLRKHLDDFFPTGPLEPEPSMIFHDDMNRHNILIDMEGALAAVIDWECISALPLYSACQYPPFLQGKHLDVKPIKSQYQGENGEVPELYWEYLEDYELTQLRRSFLDEMRSLQPAWVEAFESSQRQRDFDLAVSSYDDSFMIYRLLKWLADMESGAANVQGLEERIDNCTL